jgi:hypothetical protein
MSIKNTLESHFSRQKQVEVRISGLKDKIDVEEKTVEFLGNRFKNCKRNTPESVIPLKDQTCKSLALKNEKICKPKVYINLNKTIAEISPKS